MKKILLIAIPVVVVVVVLVALPSFGFGPMHGRHDGMMKDFMFYRMDKLADDLQLNASQRARWDTFKRDLESSIDQRRDGRKEIHKIAEQELAKENPDFAKITPLVHDQIDSTAQFAHDTVNRINELVSDLTPEQKQKIAQHLKEMHDSHH